MNKIEKEAIRRTMLEKREGISSTERAIAGKAICKNILEPPVMLLSCAWRVALYLSVRNEIPTRYLARALWNEEREICVPAWNRKEKNFSLSEFNAGTRVIRGPYGIREPREQVLVATWSVNAFIIPGVAFDLTGARLGHGMGYYDTILSQALKNSIKIGVCYEWQLLDKPLPQEDHDIRMDWVVTERRAVRCTRKN